MDCTILVRKTVDWRELHPLWYEDLPRYLPQYPTFHTRNRREHSYKRIRSNLLKFPHFLEFRQKLKELSQECLSKTGIPVCYSIDEAKKYKWIIPIDDDDWFGPSLKEAIDYANAIGNAEVVFWQHLMFRFDKGEGAFHNVFGSSNNYAIRSDISDLGNLNQAGFVFNHNFIRKRRFVCAYYPKILSAHLKHAGSLSNLYKVPLSVQNFQPISIIESDRAKLAPLREHDEWFVSCSFKI